ncbi:MAG: ABC transporter ATP-binding protein [Opitutales bacterium]|nr:ABC transporter ATP-binding protein [Opitutales bacterium]
MTETTPLLSIQNLSKNYGALQALSEVNLEIPPGEIFALLGPNGAGKTTLISCICGLIQKFNGSIEVAGYDVRRDYALTRQVVGVVPQELNFDAFCNARQTLVYQGGLFGRRRARERADELLRIFALTEKAKDNTRWLSGGMKRRLMICKALMHEPALLFLDEPTAGVDVELREELWDYVRLLRREGVTVFLTTHYLEEAEELADRIGIINQGRLILVEERDKLFAQYGSRWLELKCDRALPQSLYDRLKGYDPEPCAPGTLKLHYNESQHEDTNDGHSITERVIEAVHAEGLRVQSIEGGRSSLETIFRNILWDDNRQALDSSVKGGSHVAR